MSDPIVIDYKSDDFPFVMHLLKQLKKELVIFDLETSDLLKSENFGITEIATMRFRLDGSIRLVCRRMNPERPISEKAAEITGITNEAVANEPTYDKLMAGAMLDMARDYVVSGFNIRQFDIPGIVKMHERYSLLEPRFTDVIDVRDVWVSVAGTERGKLVDVMEHYGCQPDGAHQAFADVVMTGMILNEMLWRHGVDAILRNRVIDNEALLHNAVESDNLSSTPKAFSRGLALEAKIVSLLTSDGARYVGQNKLLKDLGLSYKDGYEVSRVVSGLISDDRFPQGFFAVPASQAFLIKHLASTIHSMGIYPGDSDFKLKPLMEVLKTLPGIPSSLDYIQLNVALALNPVEPTQEVLDKRAARDAAASAETEIEEPELPQQPVSEVDIIEEEGCLSDFPISSSTRTSFDL